MEEKLIQLSRSLFSKYGIKSISMDEISREAGISKKTLYQFFTSKEELVDKLITQFITEHLALLEECNNNSGNAVEIISKRVKGPYSLLTEFSLTFYFDLRKYFPMSWKRVVEHFRSDVQKAIRVNIEKGMEEGLYRNDLNIDFITHLRFHQLSYSILPVETTELPQLRPENIEDLTLHFLYGITTLKGRELLESVFSKKDFKEQILA
jgi:AcrR family transcriptional regulator